MNGERLEASVALFLAACGNADSARNGQAMPAGRRGRPVRRVTGRTAGEWHALGRRVGARLREMGLTPEGFGAAHPMTAPTVRAYLKGEGGRFTPRTLLRLAGHLGVSVEWLWAG